MRSEKGNGSPIPEIVIGKGKSYASIEMTVSDPNDHTWILAKTRRQKSPYQHQPARFDQFG
jgi:hypothetical protein